MKRVLSFHTVSQIGYIILGVGIGTQLGYTATIFYLLLYIPVKTSLFLIEGIIENETGSSSFDDIDGLAKRSGFLALLFIIPALSLAGLPPFSGFLAKFAVIRAGFEEGQYIIITVAIIGSFLTLVSMTKIWIGLFWGEVRPVPPADKIGIMRHHPLMSASSIGLVGVTLGFALAANPIYNFSFDAALQLLNPALYIQAVLGS
jgi:multicomponent Na+:H+ antiporter subunit D